MTLRVFGLTGGIGSGKSAAARSLRALGLPVVDADELARAAVAAGSPALAQIAAYFGTEVIQANGELDRPRLAQIVFADREARSALDAIVHPIVRELAAQRFAEIAGRGETLACYEVPLLYEVGLERVYQPVVVVTAPLSLRKSRLAARDGFDAAQIEARLAAQIPLEEKVRRADYVLDNAGSLEELEQRTRALLGELRETLS